MLPPDARSLLLDALRPPSGTRLSRAIALTYTLNLESLLVAPLAFAAHAMRESDDPITIMEGVRRCADRIDVFCQAGQMKVPPGNSRLLALVEAMVHPVRRPRPGHLFHPKLWLLRYQDETTQTTCMRLLVLSRNLTKDRSWDVCLRLDGVTGQPATVDNRPLLDLIQHAMRLTTQPVPPPRLAGISQLLQDLHDVAWDLPEGVRELRLHALGVPGNAAPDFGGTRHLVISPFCNAVGLSRCAPGHQATLVGCQDELDRLPAEVIDGRDVFVISELAGLAGEETPGSEILTGLHAKLYIAEKGQGARVLLGSANATDAAFGGNIELLAELIGSRAALGVDTMSGPTAAFRTILEPYERREPTEPDDQAQALRDLIRDIAAIPLHAIVSGEADQYQIQLTSAAALPNLDSARVAAQLYTRPGEATDLTGGQPVEARFGALALEDITPFIIITAEDGHGARERTVVLAQLVDEPPGRLERIMVQQIDTPEKFLRFLMLLLGLGAETTLPGATEADGHGTWLGKTGTGILELLLNALVDRPQQLDELGRIIAGFQADGRNRDLLPPGFEQLWQVVDEVRRREARAEARKVPA